MRAEREQSRLAEIEAIHAQTEAAATERAGKEASLNAQIEALRQDETVIDPYPPGSYTDDAKLRARQALWRFEQRTTGFRGRVYSVIEPAGDEVIIDVGCGKAT